ncbi:hypothetical protein QJS04_geneDACA022140 [Acorus gramineus]|uniref:Pectinesterase inhibitor domain-containing protein n=1 Tax=Acorus gramineus TaxID=55184 RepID=A0AAV9BL90_ACOGR|nr:hypothetical protein QJS04_geneDACA022140 [Acorus gramineus]
MASATKLPLLLLLVSLPLILSSRPETGRPSDRVDQTVTISQNTEVNIIESSSYVSELLASSTDAKDKEILASIVNLYNAMDVDIGKVIIDVKLNDDASWSFAKLAATNANKAAVLAVNKAKGLRGGPPKELVRRGENLVRHTSIVVSLTQ